MKKWIAVILVLVCVLPLVGCIDVRTIDPGEVSAIELRSGLTGDVVEVSDPEVVQKITEQIRALTFQSKRRFDGVNGCAYIIRWKNKDGDAATRIQVIDKEGCQILYGGHYYRVKGDQAIDTGYLRKLLEEANKTNQSETLADAWGVTLELKNVAPSGADLVISHSGDAPEGELNTGSPFWLEHRTQDGRWEKVSALFPDEEICWTMEAWLIPVNDSREHEVKWGNLYGELPAGQYRLGKEIMLFRGPGDYDERSCYAEFEIG